MKRASKDYTAAPSAFGLAKSVLVVALLVACALPLCRVGSALGAAQEASGQAPTLRGAPAPQSPADQRPTITVKSELVVVPVTVKDGRGNLVGDLRQNEFRILEDGVEQRITLFSTETTHAFSCCSPRRRPENKGIGTSAKEPCGDGRRLQCDGRSRHRAL